MMVRPALTGRNIVTCPRSKGTWRFSAIPRFMRMRAGQQAIQNQWRRIEERDNPLGDFRERDLDWPLSEFVCRLVCARVRGGGRAGSPGPLLELLNDMAKGKYPLPDDSHIAGTWVGELVRSCDEADSPHLERALFSLAEPRHPWAARLRKLILMPPVDAEDVRFLPTMEHPFVVEILRRSLDDTTELGSIRRKDELPRPKDEPEQAILRLEGKENPFPISLPAELNQRTVRNEVRLRACDLAAWRLSELVVYCPFYHPLAGDAEQQLENVRTALRRFPGQHRRLPQHLNPLDDVSHEDRTRFGPPIYPMGRPATTADVRAGRALFHLNGLGAVVPFWDWQDTRIRLGGKGSLSVRIVQAEAAPNGRVLLGVIARHHVGVVPASVLATPGDDDALDPPEEKPR
jgi:hypothetical protein